jgi:hypothetical protein
VSLLREVASTAAVGGPFPESLTRQLSVGPKQLRVLGMLAVPLDGLESIRDHSRAGGIIHLFGYRSKFGTDQGSGTDFVANPLAVWGMINPSATDLRQSLTMGESWSTGALTIKVGGV